MALTFDLVLTIVGLVFFALAALGLSTHPRATPLAFIAAGLFCWLLTTLV